jgi:hypothetical protein
MQKTVGGIFSLGGLAALIYFLIHYMHNSGSVSVAGTQVAQKSGSIWPIVISGIVMVIGIIILVSSRNS